MEPHGSPGSPSCPSRHCTPFATSHSDPLILRRFLAIPVLHSPRSVLLARASGAPRACRVLLSRVVLFGSNAEVHRFLKETSSFFLAEYFQIPTSNNARVTCFRTMHLPRQLEKLDNLFFESLCEGIRRPLRKQEFQELKSLKIGKPGEMMQHWGLFCY